MLQGVAGNSESGTKFGNSSEFDELLARLTTTPCLKIKNHLKG